LKFDIGEGLLELGLVLCSLFFLARKIFFPALGILASIAGTALGIWAGCFETTGRVRRGGHPLRRRLRVAGAAPGRAADEPAATRVEARSESLLAVGSSAPTTWSFT